MNNNNCPPQGPEEPYQYPVNWGVYSRDVPRGVLPDGYVYGQRVKSWNPVGYNWWTHQNSGEWEWSGPAPRSFIGPMRFHNADVQDMWGDPHPVKKNEPTQVWVYPESVLPEPENRGWFGIDHPRDPPLPPTGYYEGTGWNAKHREQCTGYLKSASLVVVESFKDPHWGMGGGDE